MTISIAILTRIIKSFSGSPEKSIISDGKISTDINDESLRATYTEESGIIVEIEENDQRYGAAEWIEHRLAKLAILADRIISYTENDFCYVEPSGKITQSVDDLNSGIEISEVGVYLTSELLVPAATETRVIYLTSDAGEGKSTVIRKAALRMAHDYKARKTHALLLPISLGGTTFLRFDHVIIGTLSKLYRFNRYYYDGIIELIKLGMIVPALDGFEEMFIEGHSGEAISSLGLLIQSLESSGSVVVAARKAFFEFTNLRTQALLFDSIKNYNVSFSRIKINHWEKKHFIQYAKNENHENPELLYEIVSSAVGDDHPVIRRAYLARKFIHNNRTIQEAHDFVSNFGADASIFNFKFNELLIEREILTTWYDRAGDVRTPLLSMENHHDLLGEIAQEMWISSSASLRLDVVDLIVDLFCESKNIPKSKTRQIKERIKNHALLVVSKTQSTFIEFDHEEMRYVYIGYIMGKSILNKNTSTILSIAQAEKLPSTTVNYASNMAAECPEEYMKTLRSIYSMDSKTSYTNMNISSIILNIHGAYDKNTYLIMSDSFIFIENNQVPLISRVHFKNCYFEKLDLSTTKVASVEFEGCDFEQIVIEDGCDLSGAIFSEGFIREVSVISQDSFYSIYDPAIAALFIASRTKHKNSEFSANDFNEDLMLFERFLRLFIRTTAVNTSSIENKLGKSYMHFCADIIPKLIENNIIEEVTYKGRGSQQRYKLMISFTMARDILFSGASSLADFIERLNSIRTREYAISRSYN